MKLKQNLVKYVFRSLFWQWSFKKKCFWDLQTFSADSFSVFSVNCSNELSTIKKLGLYRIMSETPRWLNEIIHIGLRKLRFEVSSQYGLEWETAQFERLRINWYQSRRFIIYRDFKSDNTNSISIIFVNRKSVNRTTISLFLW